MSNCLFRPPVPMLAIYAIVNLLWIAFAEGIAPNIILAAYSERSLPVLNWLFNNHRSLPIEHYLNRWSVFAHAVSIAIALHLAIVLLIRRIDRDQCSSDMTKSRSRINVILIVFAAAFFTVTVSSWVQGDYKYF